MIELPKTFVATGFVCNRCENLFLVEQEPTNQLKCPRVFCDGIAYSVQDFKLALKNNRGEKEWYQ